MYRYSTALLLKPGKILFKFDVCKCKIINNKYVLNKKFNLHFKKNYSSKTPDEPKDLPEESKKHNLTFNFDGKYKVFRDKDAQIIFDVNEEMERIKIDDLNLEEEQVDVTAEVNITHGKNGVFEIKDFVELLRRDKNVKQLFVATIPKDYNYSDYIVIVTGISVKHMKALVSNVRKIYKSIKNKNDIIPVIEGENSKHWIAIDLGNIIFHVFDHKTRIKYDLETLWSVGSEYDDLTNKKMQENIIDKYKEFLKIYQPAE